MLQGLLEAFLFLESLVVDGGLCPYLKNPLEKCMGKPDSVALKAFLEPALSLLYGLLKGLLLVGLAEHSNCGDSHLTPPSWILVV